MMRESLDANARNCFMAVSAQNGAVLTARTTPGDYSFASAAPVWVRLTRRGDVFTGGLSADAVDWVTVGSVVNVFAGTNAFVGLAVTPHDSVLTTTATLDSVALTTDPLWQQIVATNGTVLLSWNAVPGRTYRLEWSSVLVDGPWTNSLGDFNATSTTAWAPDEPATAPRFYRVRLLP